MPINARGQKAEERVDEERRDASNLLVWLIETVFCKRNIREQYKGYYRDGVRMVKIYIYIYSKYTAVDIEISLSSEILFNWIRLADAKPTMRVENRIARVQDRPTAESTPSSRPTKFSFEFASITHYWPCKWMLVDQKWTTYDKREAIDDEVEEFQGFFWIFFKGLMVCGLSIFICWMLRIEKYVIENKF